MDAARNICLLETDDEIEQLLALQAANVKFSNADHEVNDGFVTVQHDPQKLKIMMNSAPQLIIKRGDSLLAYALTMLRSERMLIPLLQPLFDLIDDLSYQGKKLKEQSYFVMGQICIHPHLRGTGAFQALYNKQMLLMKPHFDLCITEVDQKNQRSMHAHLKQGFISIHKYQLNEQIWEILLWDYKSR